MPLVVVSVARSVRPAVDAGAALVQAVPLLVSTLPEVPGDDRPVPPCDAANIPPVATRTVPVVLGSVRVVSVEAVPASRVTEPPPELALIVTGMLRRPLYTMVQVLSFEIVTLLFTVTGPNVPAF